MKAFFIEHPSPAGDTTDIGPDYFLPDVRCDHCGEEWGAPSFWFPTVNPPWIGDWRYVEDGDHKVVKWEQFVALRAALRSVDPQVAAVVPGSAVGPPSGRASKRPFPRFYCDGSKLIVEARIASLLKSKGMASRTASVRIRHRGIYLEQFLAIEPAVVNALETGQRSATVVRECATCGFQEVNRQLHYKTRSMFLHLRKAVLRDHPHVFVVRETGSLVFSEAFLCMIQSMGVGELHVQHCGDFV